MIRRYDGSIVDATQFVVDANVARVGFVHHFKCASEYCRKDGCSVASCPGCFKYGKPVVDKRVRRFVPGGFGRIVLVAVVVVALW